MKKLIAILLAILLLLCGCKNEADPDSGKTGGWLLTESEIEAAKKAAGNEPESRPDEYICYISINCKTAIDNGIKKKKAYSFLPDDGVILPETKVEYTDGETVFDVLARVAKSNGIHMEYSGTALSQSPSREACLKAMYLAKKVGTKIIFDIDYRPYNWKNADEIAIYYSIVASNSDMVMGSREEFDLTEAISAPGRTDRETAEHWMKMGNKIVIIKHGKEGSTAHTASIQSNRSQLRRLSPSAAVTATVRHSFTDFSKFSTSWTALSSEVHRLQCLLPLTAARSSCRRLMKLKSLSKKKRISTAKW